MNQLEARRSSSVERLGLDEVKSGFEHTKDRATREAGDDDQFRLLHSEGFRQDQERAMPISTPELKEASRRRDVDPAVTTPATAPTTASMVISKTSAYNCLIDLDGQVYQLLVTGKTSLDVLSGPEF